MAINTNYSNYYNYNSKLFNNTSSANSLYSYGQNTSANSLYGKNLANILKENAQSFLTSAKQQAENLSSSLIDLIGKGQKENAVFDKKTAASSNTDLLKIKSTDGKSTVADTKVTIDQVASTQKNVGTAMNSGAMAPANSFYKFEVEVDGKKHQLSFSTNGKDTNQSFQQKMADAVNKANIGINATVTTDSKTKTSTLNLETKTAGASDDGQSRFTIRDLTGDAVARTGADTVTQEAKDAVYSINGGEKKSSKSNDIDLGNGITATLVKASSEEVTITQGKDTTGVQNAVREMVNGYNALLEAAKGNDGDRRTQRLETSLTSLANTYKNALKDIGISVSDKGYLSIDESKMKTAAEDGKLEKFFTSDGKTANYGFANRLSRLAEDVSKNTTNYVGADSIDKAQSQTGYGISFGDNTMLNFSQYNQISQMTNVGLLFDSFF